MKRFMQVAALLLMTTLVIAALPASAQDATPEATAEAVVLVPQTEAAFGIETVVPEGWTNAGNGAFARQQSATDVAVIVQQSAPLASDVILQALLPRLGLTEIPESTGTYTGALEWTLYQVDVPMGAGVLRVDIALSAENGTTYLVVMQAAAEDYDSLHANVLLPVLDAYRPLVATEEAEVPYTAEDVSIENGDVTLAGTLTLPATDGPYPVIVLVSGSGPQDRDEALGGGIAMKPFKLIADALTREGVAVLRYDDRGVGSSTGDFSAATTYDFASDATAAIAYLMTRDDIDPDRVGLLGHSEGGLVAAMLGASNPDLDFVISMAGPGVNGLEVLLLQNERLLAVEGATQEQIDSQVEFVRQIAEVADDPAAIEALTYEQTIKQIEALPEDQRATVGDVEQYAHTVAQQAAQQYGAAWFKTFLEYDPAPDWAKTTIPVLGLFGGKDVQVDANQNAPALEDALTEASNTHYDVVILPDANHLFQSATTGSTSEYGTLPAEFTPEFIPTIVDWLKAQGVIAQ